MGQYFKPSNLTKKECLYPIDFEQGSKLVEHFYIGNKLLLIVEKLLSPRNQWHKNRVVWAGDYADPEVKGLSDHTLYALITNKIKPKFKTVDFRYIINHTLKKFVDKNNVKEFEKDWKIHPLPLLTCEGNGEGSGDFNAKKKDNKRMGSWARHIISVNNKVPKNYTEIDGTFIQKN